MRNLSAIALILTVFAFELIDPVPARAQGYVAPAIGVVFANPSAQGRADFVADIGWVSPVEPLGVDLDITYAPSFFGNNGPYGDNSVTTAMVNLVLAGGGARRFSAPFARYSRRSTRPYASGGIGVMHEVVNTAIPQFKVGNTDLGMNAGVGVMAFTNRAFGVRGDVRYFRDLRNNQQGNTTDIDFGAFHFWRASLGVILAF